MTSLFLNVAALLNEMNRRSRELLSELFMWIAWFARPSGIERLWTVPARLPWVRP